MEIAKRLNAIIAQLLPFLSQEVRKCEKSQPPPPPVVDLQASFARLFLAAPAAGGDRGGEGQAGLHVGAQRHHWGESDTTRELSREIETTLSPVVSTRTAAQVLNSLISLSA